MRCLPPLTPGASSLPVAVCALLLTASTTDIELRACMVMTTTPLCWWCSMSAFSSTDRRQLTRNFCCRCHVTGINQDSQWLMYAAQLTHSLPVGARVHCSHAANRCDADEEVSRTTSPETDSVDELLLLLFAYLDWASTITPAYICCTGRRLRTWDPPTRKTHLRPRRSTPNTVLMDPVGRSAGAQMPLVGPRLGAARRAGGCRFPAATPVCGGGRTRAWQKTCRWLRARVTPTSFNEKLTLSDDERRCCCCCCRRCWQGEAPPPCWRCVSVDQRHKTGLTPPAPPPPPGRVNSLDSNGSSSARHLPRNGQYPIQTLNWTNSGGPVK